MTKFLISTALVLILRSLLPVAESASEFQHSVYRTISRASPQNAVSSSQNMLMGDKIRLGSTPPSCHNRCNLCNPCIAVQVPTVPGTLPGPGVGRLAPMDDEYSYKRYPNYKPLGWKCRCGNRLFNP